VLRHRIGLSFEAQGEGVTADDVIELLLSKVAVP
jgi:MoxR-like ATPase